LIVSSPEEYLELERPEHQTALGAVAGQIVHWLVSLDKNFREAMRFRSESANIF